MESTYLVEESVVSVGAPSVFPFLQNLKVILE